MSKSSSSQEKNVLEKVEKEKTGKHIYVHLSLVYLSCKLAFVIFSFVIFLFEQIMKKVMCLEFLIHSRHMPKMR